jgi:hypothetical protein
LRAARRAMLQYKAALRKAFKTSESVEIGASLNRCSITGERDSTMDRDPQTVHIHECPPRAFLNVSCEKLRLSRTKRPTSDNPTISRQAITAKGKLFEA